MPEGMKTEDVIRLEERTRGLERSDRRHYLFELILLLGFVALCLLFVNACDIKTPEPVVQPQETPVETKKEWKYKEESAIDRISFTLGEDAKSVDVYYDGQFAVQLVAAEGQSIFQTRRYFTAEFESEEVRVYAQAIGSTTKELVGTFKYE